MGKRDTCALIRDHQGLLFLRAAMGKVINMKSLNNWQKYQENSQKAPCPWLLKCIYITSPSPRNTRTPTWTHTQEKTCTERDNQEQLLLSPSPSATGMVMYISI